MDYVLIYLRIPKTASSSVWRATLKHQYTGLVEMHGGVNKLRHESQEFRDKHHLISGHGPYGTHELFTLPSVYMTTLREPLDRTLSHYYYILGKDSHRLHAEMKSMSMQEYFTRPIADYDLGNVQTKFLSGNYCRISPTGVFHGPKDDPDMPPDILLERAKENLETCLIGLQEHLMDSLLFFSKILGWKREIGMGADRKNYNRPRFDQEPQWVLDMVAEHNQLDIELYEHAKQLWKAQFKSNKSVKDYYVYPS